MASNLGTSGNHNKERLLAADLEVNCSVILVVGVPGMNVYFHANSAVAYYGFKMTWKAII